MKKSVLFLLVVGSLWLPAGLPGEQKLKEKVPAGAVWAVSKDMPLTAPESETLRYFVEVVKLCRQINENSSPLTHIHNQGLAKKIGEFLTRAAGTAGSSTKSNQPNRARRRPQVSM